MIDDFLEMKYAIYFNNQGQIQRDGKGSSLLI